MQRPFLKWLGGKYRLASTITQEMPSNSKRLIEPFTGSAAIFLNTLYPKYLLADANHDLISLYKILSKRKEKFILCCEKLFIPHNNQKEQYYLLRTQFNQENDPEIRASLFVYLNRHCYNGLCRYSSQRGFNSPFGHYKKPYFPEKEMLYFVQHAKQASFIHKTFKPIMQSARKGDVIYCDPPYRPLSQSANFTNYHGIAFSWEDHKQLAQTAGEIAERGIRVLISNHNTKETRKLYKSWGAKLRFFQASRTISCKPNERNAVEELLAIFGK